MHVLNECSLLNACIAAAAQFFGAKFLARNEKLRKDCRRVRRPSDNTRTNSSEWTRRVLIRSGPAKVIQVEQRRPRWARTTEQRIAAAAGAAMLARLGRVACRVNLAAAWSRPLAGPAALADRPAFGRIASTSLPRIAHAASAHKAATALRRGAMADNKMKQQSLAYVREPMRTTRRRRRRSGADSDLDGLCHR